jgi:hypothetical protein
MMCDQRRNNSRLGVTSGRRVWGELVGRSALTLAGLFEEQKQFASVERRLLLGTQGFRGERFCHA